MSSRFRAFNSHSPRIDFDFSFSSKSEEKDPVRRKLFSVDNRTFISKPSDIPAPAPPPAPPPQHSTLSSSSDSTDPSIIPAMLSESLRNLKLSSGKNVAISSPSTRRRSTGFGGLSSKPRGSLAKGKVTTPFEDEDSSMHDDLSNEGDVRQGNSEHDMGDDADDETYSESSQSEEAVPSNPDAAVLSAHLRLLEHEPDMDELNEIKTTPIFTEPVRKHAVSIAPSSPSQPFTQYGLIAGNVSGNGEPDADPRIFYNVSAPSSVFICGSQGSGKSHTLSCLLENCLMQTSANKLPRPLTGVVFHYDTFISDTGGSPCEAAWLSSNPSVRVRVLCPPTNIGTLRKLYKQFSNIKVEELRLSQGDLNTKRMLDLMAATSSTTMPLYLHVANRILRDMRIRQQLDGSGFDYSTFKMLLQEEDLTKEQLAPLKQRLDTLESFMVKDQAKAYDMFNREKQGHISKKTTTKALASKGTNWKSVSGQLTIVDLSCPCVTADMACSLFNICLSLFLEQDSQVGRVVALDEAHKYMNRSEECQTLTETLLATIRLQRHLGARILISTQEPTISPKLLDLCSVTIVHRFTSPDWLNALKKHLAGVSSASKLLAKVEKLYGDENSLEPHVRGLRALKLGSDDPALELFSKIVGLKTGEALMFAPSAIIGVRNSEKYRHSHKSHEAENGVSVHTQTSVNRLAHGVLKVRVRNRMTADGGRSIMAD